MKRKIRSYEDLEREEQLLEELLQTQKQLVQLDIELLKQQLKPATMALQFFNRITTVDKSNLLLNEGANKVIDFVLNKFILTRSGWITKFMVPFFLKNYSSHLIGDNKANIVEKIFSLFGRKNGKATASSIVTAPGIEN
ncbi:MAG TPA: hypothetical protein VKB95_07870 [Chitinophagaceae bacterium]|nr:hypothetical protein [Chitinophagaceae bacterium]